MGEVGGVLWGWAVGPPPPSVSLPPLFASHCFHLCTRACKCARGNGYRGEEEGRYGCERGGETCWGWTEGPPQVTPLSLSFHCYTDPCTRVCKPAGGEGYGGWDCGVGEAVGGEGFGVGVVLTPPTPNPPPPQAFSHHSLHPCTRVCKRVRAQGTG